MFWCGCEFIAFTTHNIFTNFDCIFPTHDGMHILPYYISQDGMAREQLREGAVKMVVKARPRELVIP